MNAFAKEIKNFMIKNKYQVYNNIIEITDRKIIIERKDSFCLDISQYKIAQEYINIFALSKQHSLHATLLNNGRIMIS